MAWPTGLRSKSAGSVSTIALVTGLGVLAGLLASGVGPAMWAVGAGVAVALLVLTVWHPGLPAALFWIAYGLLTTMFSSTVPAIQGFYYPLYGLMIFNLVVLWARGQGMPKGGALTWAGLGLFLVSGVVAFWAFVPGSPVNGAQRLFIYALGPITALQVLSDKRGLVRATMAWTAIVVSLWALGSAVLTGYAYRGGTGVNPDYISFIIALGAVILFDLALLDAQRPRWLVFLALSSGLLALFTLASRGEVLALIVAMAVMTIWFPGKREVKWGWIVVAAIVLMLPGGRDFIARFSETGLGSLNGRTPLWIASTNYLYSHGPGNLLLGNGMGESAMLAQSVNPSLNSVHNSYLETLIDQGLLGLFGLTIFLISEFAKEIKRAREGRLKVGLIVFLAMSCLTASLTDNFLFWIAAGMVTSWGESR